MASITIRNLEEDLKRRLRLRAAEHGRSMEEEHPPPPRLPPGLARRAAGASSMVITACPNIVVDTSALMAILHNELPVDACVVAMTSDDDLCFPLAKWQRR